MCFSRPCFACVCWFGISALGFELRLSRLSALRIIRRDFVGFGIRRRFAKFPASKTQAGVAPLNRVQRHRRISGPESRFHRVRPRSSAREVQFRALGSAPGSTPFSPRWAPTLTTSAGRWRSRTPKPRFRRVQGRKRDLAEVQGLREPHFRPEGLEGRERP